MSEFEGNDRREFLRYEYAKPLHFSIVSSPKDRNSTPNLVNAITKNLSASGILFQTKEIPDIASLLILDLDFKTAKICREIERRAMIINNKLLGKVVRIEDSENGMCDVGVAFVTKDSSVSEDLKKLTG